MIGNTNTSGNISEYDSIDSSRLDRPLSPPFTPDVPTHPTTLIRLSNNLIHKLILDPMLPLSEGGMLLLNNLWSV